jgi:CMP/dCMP kinase
MAETRKKRSSKVANKRGPKISVIISGMPSVGKTTAANAIGVRYHLLHVAGGDMLKELAYERGYRPSGADWWDTPEGMSFIAERKSNPDFDKEVDRKLAEHLKKGNVVMTSYSMPWLAENGTLKLWFDASLKTRAGRLAGRDSISLGKALEIVKQRDEDNRKLYKRLYGIDFGKDLSPFNFVLDTERMSAKEVTDAACKLVSEYRKSLSQEAKGSR